jgi:hypothetical protein
MVPQILILFFLINFFASCTIEAKINTNYREYHSRINKAEELIFLKKDVDSALFIYSEVFKDYDFVFVQDCVIAAQIALVFKKDLLVLEFLNKGFENGLKISNLPKYRDIENGETKYLNIFENFLSLNENEKLLKKYYEIERQKYLQRINAKLLDKIIKRYAIDQSHKNIRKNTKETKVEQDSLMNIVMKKNVSLIDSLARIGLFPSEKILGINDNNLFNELNLPYKPLIDYYKIFLADTQKKFNISENHFILDEDCLTFNMTYVMLYHYEPSYDILSKHFDNLIMNGLIHPREVASLEKSFNDDVYKYTKLEKYKDVSQRINCFDTTLNNRKIVNKKRLESYLVPVEVDMAKKKFEAQYKLRFYMKPVMNR